MMKSNYPFFQAHLKEHENFTDKVKGFLRGCKDDREGLTLEMLTFLRDWIFSHTTKLDIKFGEHLQKSRG